MQKKKRVERGAGVLLELDPAAGHAQLADFFENAAIGLHIVAADGTILEANRAELELLGYARDEYVGKHIAEFHVDRPVIEDMLLRLGAGETLRVQPARLRCKNGDIKEVQIDSNSRFVGGVFISTRCLTRDVTEQRRVERELAISQARLKQVTEELGLVAWVTDLETTKILYLSEAFERVWGIPPSHLALDPWAVLDVIHADDRPRLIEAARAPDWFIEYRIHKGDELRWLATRARVVKNVAGTDLLIGVTQDITAQRAARDGIWAMSQQFRSLLQAAADGVLTTDAGGRIETMNPAAEALLGVASTRLVTELIATEWPPSLDSSEPHETTAWTTSGAALTVTLAASRVEVQDKVLYVLLVRDLSEQVRAERQVLQHCDALQLRLGSDLHDGLGQLLTGAAFMARGIEHSAPKEFRAELARLVAVLNEAITRTQKIARGLTPMLAEHLTLAEALQGVCNAARDASGIACTLECPSEAMGLPASTCAQICLLVQEAIHNAVRHGEASRVEVSLRVTEKSQVLTVYDDGKGFDPRVQRKGLGLASMRYRARAIGGTLSIGSDPGSGTVVRCVWKRPTVLGHA